MEYGPIIPKATAELVFVKLSCSLVFRASLPSSSLLQILHILFALSYPLRSLALEQCSPHSLQSYQLYFPCKRHSFSSFACATVQVCARSNLTANTFDFLQIYHWLHCDIYQLQSFFRVSKGLSPFYCRVPDFL